MNAKQVIRKLKAMSDAKNVEDMGRFGINTETSLGVSMPKLRALGKEIGKDHALAIKLWDSKIHEARILASIVDEPEKVSPKQFDKWVRQFDSWDICDQAMLNLFWKLPCAYELAIKYADEEKEFVKRAGFALMAVLAVKDKKADDKKFENFLPHIIRHSDDERNFVRKAVNWALRQIGKRNKKLNRKAIECAEKISKKDSKTARWIASDALRELKSEAVTKKLC